MIQPLVSIIVLTYNSSLTILETLESLKKQSYPNIELIISDDASKDETVKICQTWVQANSYKFKKCTILTTESNTGVSANCNRGCKIANGVWIKLIAGDDALYPNAIYDFMTFSHNYPQAKIIHSKINCFFNTLNEKNLIKGEIVKYPPYFTDNKNNNVNKQHNYLCLKNTIAALSVIIKKQIYDEIGGFDEDIKQCEDWPMWLKLTQKGYTFFFLNAITGKYRIHATSISGKETQCGLFKCFFEIDHTIYNKYIKNNCPILIKLMNRYDFYVRKSLNQLKLNNKRLDSRLIYSFLMGPYKLVNLIIAK